MEAKEDGNLSSPLKVIQHISEEAVRVAGEAINCVKTSSSTQKPLSSAHRRSQSDVVPLLYNNSFQRWKSSMRRALRLGDSSQEQNWCSSFNPEISANQKRQWYQRHSTTLEHKKWENPESLFEHFIVVGLHPNTNLEVVEGAFAKKKKWELQLGKPEMIDFRLLSYRVPSPPTLEPQILFKYPPGKRLAMRMKDLAAFCFPGGVKAGILERTPSLSELNELIYGQEHLGRDDLSFIFSLKVADNATLYGVCLLVQEVVQRSPAILGSPRRLSQSSGGSSRFLVSAPRCYCVLTRVPFFELHYEMLNSIIAQERLNRITQFIHEINLTDQVSSAPRSNDRMVEGIDSSKRDTCNNWMASAIPIDSAIAITAAAAGLRLDAEIMSSSSRWESDSSECCFTCESLYYCQARDVDKNDRKDFCSLDDGTFEASNSRSYGLERISGTYEDGAPELGAHLYRRSHMLHCIGSFESLISSVRSMRSEDEDDETFFGHEKVDNGNEMIMEWARESKNDLLQIVCAYHAMPIPTRGSRIIFQPLEHLPAIEYWRPPVSALELGQKQHDLIMHGSLGTAEVNLTLAAAEEAVALSVWTTATICRALSLENVLALVSGVLLEKQVVVLCPNLGVLSAVVLSLIPMIRPFQWQSLFLPVLPGKMLDFLDAPVPFIVGVQHKPADLKVKTSCLVRINVAKDQVKTCSLPVLPRQKELISILRPMHARLSCEHSTARRHPVYKCNEVQAEAATQFLTAMRSYLESLCSDLRSHTITSVQSHNDRVSLLLKESFIDSFPDKERPFIKLLVDTQMFSVLSDSRLCIYENGYG